MLELFPGVEGAIFGDAESSFVIHFPSSCCGQSTMMTVTT